MTEHKKIPLPPDEPAGTGDAASLIERASGAFGLGRLAPAAVPDRLAPRTMKRARKLDRGIPVQPAATPVPAAPDPAAAEATTLAPAAAVAAGSALINTAPPPLSVRRHAIDREHLRDQGLIDPDGPVSELMEEFRIVKRQLLSTAQERGTAASRRILISSPHPDDGKTFCAINLAIAMAAERDMQVVLVDADVAKPSILSTLGLPRTAGLMGALADPEIAVEDLVLGTDIPGLWVLPAGSTTTSDAEYLASDATARVLDRLTVGAPDRIVIFDTPPALAAAPAAELAKHVGQVVLVARADVTGRSALEDACQLLSACADIKLLLNAANFSPSGRRFGSYYR